LLTLEIPRAPSKRHKNPPPNAFELKKQALATDEVLLKMRQSMPDGSLLNNSIYTSLSEPSNPSE
jgi:hypothetical protein